MRRSVYISLLYKLSGRADGWACLHAQTYAHPEANRYEQGATCAARGESANTGEGFESAESAKKPVLITIVALQFRNMCVYYISSPSGRADGRVYTAGCADIRRQTGMSYGAMCVSTAQECEYR